jgi:protein gp37/ParB-like chromosome segregation protein Spo0J
MTNPYGDYRVHPVADLFPLMSDDELERLAEDIKLNGLLEPIVLNHDGSVLIDGRNRYRACVMANVQPETKRLGAHYSEEEIVRHVVSRNIKRRHMDAGQRAALGISARDYLAAAAKERQIAGAKVGAAISRGEDANGHSPKSGEAGGKAAKAIAAMAEVSTSTVEQALAVADVNPRLLNEVRAGTTTLNKAYQEVRQARRAEESPPSETTKTTIMLKTHDGQNVEYKLPKGKATFNRTNEQVSWSAWTWNPVTGCPHGCPYCYAREIANQPRMRDTYPVDFTPLFRPYQLDAPKNTKIPADVASDPTLGRVFVCSMADLYGKWVPDEWIEKVHAACIAAPQWEYLMLTKFPRRYVGLDLPPMAWLGTSVDEQKRVRLAEEAFREIKDVRVKWLSLEPLLAPLKFNDLSMFDWIVIGSQSATNQPDGPVGSFAPPFEWVARLTAQAHEAGCRVYHKPNLLGVPNPQSAGMTLIQEGPRLPPIKGRQMDLRPAAASG